MSASEKQSRSSLQVARRQTCTDHCGSCGQHFHGLGAFDLHRVGDFGEGTRRCAPAGELAALRAWTRDGLCTLTGRPLEPVTVWQDARSADRLAAAGLSGASSRGA